MIKIISKEEFESFANNHPLSNYFQSKEYAEVLENLNIEYNLIGYFKDDKLEGASLIILKTYGIKYKYGYSPKGFLIDYYNMELFKTFTKELKEYYIKKNVVFIKINPEIFIGDISKENLLCKYNSNLILTSHFSSCGYRKIDKKKISLVEENYSTIVNLETFKNKTSKSRYIKARDKGLYIEKGNKDSILKIFDFIKDENHSLSDYFNFYNIFSKNDLIDVFLIKINFEEYISGSRNLYVNENEKNEYLNKLLLIHNTERNLKEKMESDKILEESKIDLNRSLQYRGRESKCVGGIITLKYNGRIIILSSGYDEEYSFFEIKDFMYYELFKFYNKTFKYVDLDGIKSTESIDPKYKKLDRFKVDTSTDIVELIGEYDLILNETVYSNMKRKDVKFDI